MLTLEEVNQIISDIQYKDWSFVAKPITEGVLLYPVFYRKDSNTEEFGYCNNMRPWLVEWHRNEAYLVQTTFAMVKLAEEHETREAFEYKGQKPYSPHNIEEVFGGEPSHFFG